MVVLNLLILVDFVTWIVSCVVLAKYNSDRRSSVAYPRAGGRRHRSCGADKHDWCDQARESAAKETGGVGSSLASAICQILMLTLDLGSQCNGRVGDGDCLSFRETLHTWLATFLLNTYRLMRDW